MLSTYNVVISQSGPAEDGTCVMEAAIQSEQLQRLELDVVRYKEMTASYSNNSNTGLCSNRKGIFSDLLFDLQV